MLLFCMTSDGCLAEWNSFFTHLIRATFNDIFCRHFTALNNFSLRIKEKYANIMETKCRTFGSANLY